MEKIVGLILARGGSKRIPKKNIQDLGGKPLIAWTIESAINSRMFTEVIVSTDDEKIEEISILHGASVPWLRPSKLAEDKTLSIDVVIHTIHRLIEIDRCPDAIMLLQPTTPFRKVERIKEAIKLYITDTSKSIVSFSKVELMPEWCFRINNEHITPILGWDKVSRRSQEIKCTYQINGSIYLASVENILANKSFINKSTIPIIHDGFMENIDIDTECDLKKARMHLEDLK